MFGLEECAGRIGNPKQNELRRVTAFFVEEGWFNEQRSASLGDGIKDTYSLEVKGGGVFYFKTIIDNLDDNS